jgi:hypothetical protein
MFFVKSCISAIKCSAVQELYCATKMHEVATMRQTANYMVVWTTVIALWDEVTNRCIYCCFINVRVMTMH